MQNSYGGMTVNERLYVSGLLDKFDVAVREKNIELITTILTEVELTDESIRSILNSTGLSNTSSPA